MPQSDRQKHRTLFEPAIDGARGKWDELAEVVLAGVSAFGGSRPSRSPTLFTPVVSHGLA